MNKSPGETYSKWNSMNFAIYAENHAAEGFLIFSLYGVFSVMVKLLD